MLLVLLSACGGKPYVPSPEPTTPSTAPADVVGTDGGTPDDGGSGEDSGTETTPAPTVPGEVRATQLTQFQMVQGQASWEAGAQNRAANVVLDLYQNGSFSFTTVDTVGVPVTGTYSVSGAEVDFEGQTVTSGPAGSSTLEIQGSVDLTDRTMSLSWVGSSMGAVVNGQSFSSANSEAWKAQIAVSFS